MQSKEDFLAAFERKPVAIDVSGIALHIRPLGPADMRAVNALPDADAKAGFAIVRSVCGPTGVRLFADEDAGSIGELIPNYANEELVLEIAKLNRIGEYAKKAPSPATTN